jgi:hypothetical protein
LVGLPLAVGATVWAVRRAPDRGWTKAALTSLGFQLVALAALIVLAVAGVFS